MNLLNNIITSLPKEQEKKVEPIVEDVFTGFECPNPQDKELNDRYRLINAFCNLEFKNSKQRVMTVKKIVEEIMLPIKEVNSLFICYAPITANKVVKPNFLPDGKVNHYKNLLLYVGITDTSEDKTNIGKSGVVGNKDNSKQSKWDTGSVMFT